MLNRTIVSTLMLLLTASTYTYAATDSSLCLENSCVTFNLYNNTASILGVQVSDIGQFGPYAAGTFELTLPITDNLHIFYNLDGGGTAVELTKDNAGQYLTCYNTCHWDGLDLSSEFTCVWANSAGEASAILSDSGTGGALNNSSCW